VEIVKKVSSYIAVLLFRTGQNTLLFTDLSDLSI